MRILICLFIVFLLTGCSEQFTRALINAYAENGHPFYMALQETKYPEDAEARKNRAITVKVKEEEYIEDAKTHKDGTMVIQVK